MSIALKARESYLCGMLEALDALERVLRGPQAVRNAPALALSLLWFATGFAFGVLGFVILMIVTEPPSVYRPYIWFEHSTL